MDRMGFGKRWMSWIKWCTSTAPFLILINGTSAGFFQSSRGLRQGDPLFPYVFVIGMEALSSLLKRAVEGNFLSDSRVADLHREEKGGPRVEKLLLIEQGGVMQMELAVC